HFFSSSSRTPPLSPRPLHDALPIFDAEIAAGDHDRIGFGEDRVDVFEGRVLLDLGNDERPVGDPSAEVDDIGSALNEGEGDIVRSEEHTSELQSRENLVCRLLLEKK